MPRKKPPEPPLKRRRRAANRDRRYQVCGSWLVWEGKRKVCGLSSGHVKRGQPHTWEKDLTPAERTRVFEERRQ